MHENKLLPESDAIILWKNKMTVFKVYGAGFLKGQSEVKAGCNAGTV